MRPLDPAKQEKIIKAVFTLCGKQGLAGVNITGISKEAKIGVGTLYTYFKSKEEVIQSAYSGVRHMLTEQMFEGLERDQPIKESFKRIYLNTVNYRLKHFDENVFIDQYIQSNYLQLNFEKQMLEFAEQNKPLYHLIQRGQSEGLFPEMDPFMTVTFLNGAIRTYTNNIKQKLIQQKKQVMDDYFEMIWKGLAV